MERVGEEKVVESIKEILPITWESHSFMESGPDHGKLNKGSKLLVEFKLNVVEGKKDEAKMKLDEFLKLLDGTAIPLWERNKENFEQLLKNFDNYFEKLKESLKPSYENYLNEKKKRRGKKDHRKQERKRNQN
jgi:hypothetical protein